MIKTKHAKDVNVGDTIRFWIDSSSFVVEEIESTQTGMIRFRDGLASNCYCPLEVVLVEEPVDAITEYYTDRANGHHRPRRLVDDSGPKPEDYEDVGTYGSW